MGQSTAGFLSGGTLNTLLMVRLALLLTLIFAALALAIRARPLAAGPLDWLFLPDADCPAPCFLNIRPHETAIQEALERLRAHPAVDQATVKLVEGQAFIAWNWRTESTEDQSYRFSGLEGRIEGLVLPTDVTFGDLRLALGAPQRITVTTNSNYAPRVAYVLEYPARALHLYAEFHVCEINQSRFWRMRVDGDERASFHLGLDAPDYIRVMPNRPVELDPSTWAKQLRDLCRR